jgi:hypothetical protein
MPKKLLLPVLLAALSLGGCFPYHYTQRPGATGTVVDAQSGAPIRGALVSLVGYGMRSRPQDDVFDVRTAADGRFEILPVKEWNIYVVPMHPASIPVALKVRANGYTDLDREISFSMLGPAVEDFGALRMTRFGR